MPTYTEQKFFYELLVRGDENGIKGAHAVYMIRTLKDGEVISQVADRALPIAMAQGDPGIPLAQVLGDVNTQALATLEAKDTTIAEKDVLIATTREEHSAALQVAASATAQAEAARDAAIAQAASLQAQLDALKPVINGVPQFIKKWQLWAGLRIDDPTLATYNAVKAYTESFSGMRRDLWLDSTGIEREAPGLEDFKTLFRKTDADIDGMFTRYAAITAVQAAALD